LRDDVRSYNEARPDGTTNGYHNDLPRLQATMEVVMGIFLEVFRLSDIHIVLFALLFRGIEGIVMLIAGHVGT
jgi:hypothetical protein